MEMVNRMKKWIFCFLVLGFFFMSPVTVEATQSGSVPLDNFTGQPVVKQESTTNTNEIPVLSNCVYDKSTQQFVYTVDQSADLKIMSSVADGMITNNIVKIETNITEALTLIKNGKVVEKPDLSSIRQFGSYILQYQGKKVLEFSIIGDYSSLDSFDTPKGFVIENVMVDGVPAQFTYDGVTMETEGTYEVSYICEATGRTYSFKTKIDRTAPTLVLEELDEKGRSKGPVDISDREPNTVIKMTINGEEVAATDILKQSGKYSLTISDAAGNYNTYNFVILIYFNTSGIFFLVLVAAVVGGIAAYIIISAKHLKVF
jgi:hypothetical protein